jgi:HD-GYP domain-containing protein (c-di-GMP phosphodiesterase class II)
MNARFKQVPGYFLQKTDIGSWMKYLMYKSPLTYQHCVRVALLAEIVAPYLDINQDETDDFVRGCYLHDLGKVRIANAILHKKERLTKREWELLKRHPAHGEDILLNYGLTHIGVLQLVRYHHERFDGGGYPDGLAGTKIPYMARACAVLDAFDAMLNERPYSISKSLEQVCEEMFKNRNTQFDGEIVDKLLAISDEEMDRYRGLIPFQRKQSDDHNHQSSILIGKHFDSE